MNIEKKNRRVIWFARPFLKENGDIKLYQYSHQEVDLLKSNINTRIISQDYLKKICSSNIKSMLRKLLIKLNLATPILGSDYAFMLKRQNPRGKTKQLPSTKYNSVCELFNVVLSEYNLKHDKNFLGFTAENKIGKIIIPTYPLMDNQTMAFLVCIGALIKGFILRYNRFFYTSTTYENWFKEKEFRKEEKERRKKEIKEKYMAIGFGML